LSVCEKESVLEGGMENVFERKRKCRDLSEN